MNREPLIIRAAIVAAIIACLNAAVAFGLPISSGQAATLNTAVDLVSIAVLVIWTRGKVTPTADPRADDGTALVPEREDYS